MNKMRVVPEWQTYLPHYLVIALLIVLAHTMAYYDEMEDAKAQAQTAIAAQVDCMNGEWRGRTESGAQIGCMKAEVLEVSERSGS